MATEQLNTQGIGARKQPVYKLRCAKRFPPEWWWETAPLRPPVWTNIHGPILPSFSSSRPVSTCRPEWMEAKWRVIVPLSHNKRRCEIDVFGKLRCAVLPLSIYSQREEDWDTLCSNRSDRELALVCLIYRSIFLTNPLVASLFRRPSCCLCFITSWLDEWRFSASRSR